jgi:hypothetical protein
MARKPAARRRAPACLAADKELARRLKRIAGTEGEALLAELSEPLPGDGDITPFDLSPGEIDGVRRALLAAKPAWLAETAAALALAARQQRTRRLWASLLLEASPHPGAALRTLANALSAADGRTRPKSIAETLALLAAAQEARAPAGEDALYALDRAAARVLQAEIAARGTFEGEASVHVQVLAALETRSPDLARRYRAAASRQRLLLQSVRNLAVSRGYLADGLPGDVVAFDPARHTLAEAPETLPARVRLLDPPIIREQAPGALELLQKGEAEPAGDSE